MSVKKLLVIFYMVSHAILGSLPGHVYINYKPHSFMNCGNGKVVKSRMGNQLLTFFCAYATAKQKNGTLVFTPIDLDIKKGLVGRLPLIETVDFNKLLVSGSIKKENDTILSIPLICTEAALRKYKLSPYKEELKEIVSSTFAQYHKLEKTPDTLHVAIHVRNGFGFDNPLRSIQLYNRNILENQKHISPSTNPINKNSFLDVQRPLKAPPLQYYVDAINYFNKKIIGDKIFYLFTDHPDTQYIMDQLNSQLEQKIAFKKPTQYSLSEGDTRDIEELLLMSNMDALIRPGQSTFSLAAEALSEYQYVVFPSNPRWIGNCLVMERIYLRSKTRESDFLPYSFLDK